ncbi:MAG: ABC transporter substrate-binding protein [Chromatiaceae bacterium]|nr:ABC transporter substrate-binding protein [Chromatiaceae bacterium]
MSNRGARVLRALARVAVLALAGLVAGPVAALTLGYIELEDDDRYEEAYLDLRLPAKALGRPFAAAEVAVKEGRFALKQVGDRIELERVDLREPEDLPAALDRLYAEGVRFILLDLPHSLVARAADQLRGRDALLFNLTATEDDLRRSCQAGLVHIAPSQAMLNDALAQYLVSRKWRKLLLLTGPSAADAVLRKSFDRSAKRFGLKIVAEKPFVLGKDPRQRAGNNVALLTGGPDQDVVVVLDATGEFARDVPYQVQRPRPVAGSAGLVADWWHWAWERHGAPQLNNRVSRKTGHLMRGQDWSAWAAVKLVVEAVLRTGSTDPSQLQAYIRGDQLVLDGFKGYPLNLRPWSNQLRQPIFLTTGNAVVARAPLAGFLHPQSDLDTLGLDEREVRCEDGGGG